MELGKLRLGRPGVFEVSFQTYIYIYIYIYAHPPPSHDTRGSCRGFMNRCVSWVGGRPYIYIYIYIITLHSFIHSFIHSYIQKAGLQAQVRHPKP